MKIQNELASNFFGGELKDVHDCGRENVEDMENGRS